MCFNPFKTSTNPLHLRVLCRINKLLTRFLLPHHMSVASYQGASGAVSAGLAFNMPPRASQATSAPDSCCDRGLGQVGTPQAGTATRGELCGDNCVTFDLYYGPNATCSSLWSEESGDCIVTPEIASTVQFTDAGKACLKDKSLSIAEILASNEVFVGKQRTDMTKCDVLKALLDTEDLKRSDGVPVEAASGAPLVALTALLLSQAASTATASTSSEDGKDKKTKGGKKSKKIKQRSITLVAPAGFTQTQRAVLINAAERANMSVRNIFNRGVSTVAGMLYSASRVREPKAGAAVDMFDALRLRTDAASPIPPIVLYLNVYEVPGAAASSYDAVLVQCDGQQGAQQTGSPLRFERLCTLATLGGVLRPSTEQGASQQLQRIVKRLMTAAPGAALATVVLGGLLTQKLNVTKDEWTDAHTRSLLELPSEVSVVRAAAGDAAVGACVLSAAELDSSKQYMQLADGNCKIGYLLPVADGALEGRDVAVRVQWDQQQADEHAAADRVGPRAGADSDVPVWAVPGEGAVFRVGCRLWKEDAGPIPPREGGAEKIEVLSQFRKSFQWGVKVPVKSAQQARNVKPALGWPRVQVLERTGDDAAHWKVLKTLTPLLSVAATEDIKALEKAEPVETCALHVRVDPSTGTVAALQTKGATTSESRSVLWGRVQLVCVLVLPFLLIALWYYSGYITEWYTDRQHAAWLADFYAKNAPEKLKDPQYVGRTIAKYKGRMFLLWRALERAYKVKWQPPHSVLDHSGASSTVTADEF